MRTDDPQPTPASETDSAAAVAPVIETSPEATDESVDTGPPDAPGADRWSGLAFTLLAGLSAVFPLLNFDIWWHLATGRFILGGGGIPRTDPFSYTASDVSWIDHEWLFQVIVELVHRLGGVNGLIGLRVVLICAIAACVYRAVGRHQLLPGPALALLLVPFLLAGRARFLMRPELFTLLFLVVVVDALLRPRSQPTTWKTWWWIPPLFALWANIHAALVVGLAILGLHAAGRTFETLLGLPRGNRPSLVESWGLLVASTLAVLVNPYGVRIFEVPFHLAAINASGVLEALEAKPPTLEEHGLYFAMVGVSGLITLAMLWRDRQRIDWTALAVLGLLAALSLRYVRNIALFSMLAPILVSRLLAGRGETAQATSHLGSRLAQWLHPATTAAGLLLLGASLVVSGGGLGANAMLPTAAADFLEEQRPPGNLFNFPDAYGGYLGWRLNPDIPVYFDGRNDVFFEVWKTFREAEARQGTWRQHLTELDVGVAVVGYLGTLQPVTLMDFGTGQPRTVYRPWAANHFPRREWGLVHWDESAMVYVRRRPENQELLEAFEDRNLYPEDVGYQLEMLGQGRARREGALVELQRRLELNPDNRRAQALFQAVQGAPPPRPRLPPGAPAQTRPSERSRPSGG